MCHAIDCINEVHWGSKVDLSDRKMEYGAVFSITQQVRERGMVYRGWHNLLVLSPQVTYRSMVYISHAPGWTIL